MRSEKLSRRAFLEHGTLVMGSAATLGFAGTTFAETSSPESVAKPILRCGLLTDVHYAEKKHAGNRYYRESGEKVREAVDSFNREKLRLAIELGDFIDAAKTVDTELGYLKTIEVEFARFKGERHYVGRSERRGSGSCKEVRKQTCLLRLTVTSATTVHNAAASESSEFRSLWSAGR